MKERAISLNANNYFIKSLEVDADSMSNLFSTPWNIVPKYKRKQKKIGLETPDEANTPDVSFGELTFGGLHKNGRVFLEYKLNKKITPQDFVYIIECMTEWAFSQKDVYSVLIDCPQDLQTVELLKKNGFVELSEDAQNPSGKLILEKEAPSYRALYTCIGIIIGLCLGGCFGSIPVGVIIGVAAGFGAGAGIDKKEANHRKIIERKDANSGEI